MGVTLKPKPNHPNGKSLATIEDIKDKLDIGAVGNTKKRCHKYIIPERDKIVIDK